MNGRTADIEENLVRLARNKDAAAMRSIYLSHVQYLTSVCSRYITDKDELKDILQESFIKIFGKLRKFEWKGSGSLRAWMSRIVVNEALSSLRTKARKSIVSYEPELLDLPQEDVDPKLDDIPMDVLQQMILSLPDGYRTIFNLYVFEDMSHAQIAKTLGISENTSRSQFFRAKASLCRMVEMWRKSEDR